MIKKLIDKSLREQNLHPDLASFDKLSGLINKNSGSIEISPRYLSENLYAKSKKAIEDQEELIGVRISYVNTLCRYVGFDTFDEFVKHEENPGNPRLDACLGDWTSYVRANSGGPDILVAPVRLYREDIQYKMKLWGLSRNFEGMVSLVGNSLVTTLYSEQGKILNLIFHLGLSVSPELLQGVFSGMSSAGDPIAGREILVKTPEGFAEPKKSWVVNFADRASAEQQLDSRILDYFDNYSGNCIKTGRSSSFTLEDLKL